MGESNRNRVARNDKDVTIATKICIIASPQCNKVVTDIFVSKLDYCSFGVPYPIPSQCKHAVSALAVSMPVWPRTTKLYLQSLRKSLCKKVVSATYNLVALRTLQ